LNKHISFDTDVFIKNFPLSNLRDNQDFVLNEISEAFKSDCRYILLEAPTGFGKSAVGMTVAITLGSSYTCTSTKDLQAQYKRDFPFVRIAKGMNNFSCLIKEDLIKNDTYKCGSCHSSSFASRGSTNAYCSHTTVAYGPCLISNSEISQNGCIYKPSVSAYEVIDRRTKEEQVFMSSNYREIYQDKYSEWLQAKNIRENRKEWIPCGYYDQLNIARNSSHSIFNYSMFLTLLPSEKIIAPREILILDECHLLETEVLNQTGYIISKNKWRKYLPGFSLISHNDMEVWIDLLIQLEARMLALLGDAQKIKELFISRKQKYNWKSNNIMKIKRITNTRITDFITAEEGKEELKNNATHDSNEIEELEDTIVEYLAKRISSKDIADQARLETDKLTGIINAILSNPDNWIVSKVRKEYDEIMEIELKPLDISPYCKDVFERCSKTIAMSATILNSKAFCRNVGLNTDDVKFIKVQSDFPILNRPIYPLNIAYLNYNNLQLYETKLSIANAVDNIMTVHGKDKGIIHTTSYEQLNFIKENISGDNSRRLLVTDPDIQREDVIVEHTSSTKPTVLISPSFYTGIDLKDDLSRFQIITKIPYPNLGDKWINAKRYADEEWYHWQTALRLVQAYGRSVRSKEDWAKTYILDSAFGYFVIKNRDIFPNWFKQAIRSVDRKPLFKAVSG
jgi:ATP-dependent DNA helicase DinG